MFVLPDKENHATAMLNFRAITTKSIINRCLFPLPFNPLKEVVKLFRVVSPDAEGILRALTVSSLTNYKDGNRGREACVSLYHQRSRSHTGGISTSRIADTPAWFGILPVSL
jgi:hypothetical protein